MGTITSTFVAPHMAVVDVNHTVEELVSIISTTDIENKIHVAAAMSEKRISTMMEGLWLGLGGGGGNGCDAESVK